jgi:hypothetical protein
VKFGIKLDAFALHTEKLASVNNYQNKYDLSPPRAAYLFLKANLSQGSNSYVTFRAGYLYASDFSGFELGMFFYKYLVENTYLHIGVNIHFNREKIIRNDIIDKSHSKPINFVSAGLGYYFTKHLFTELSVDFALNTEYGISTPLNQNIPSKPKSIFNIIRLGIGYQI